jgi:hypothetical protein
MLYYNNLVSTVEMNGACCAGLGDQDVTGNTRRHYSVSDGAPESSVLRKVASLTLDRATLEQRVSRPKTVPQKLEYQIYEKFEGE